MSSRPDAGRWCSRSSWVNADASSSAVASGHSRISSASVGPDTADVNNTPRRAPATAWTRGRPSSASSRSCAASRASNDPGLAAYPCCARRTTSQPPQEPRSSDTKDVPRSEYLANRSRPSTDSRQCPPVPTTCGPACPEPATTTPTSSRRPRPSSAPGTTMSRHSSWPSRPRQGRPRQPRQPARPLRQRDRRFRGTTSPSETAAPGQLGRATAGLLPGVGAGRSRWPASAEEHSEPGRTSTTSTATSSS